MQRNYYIQVIHLEKNIIFKKWLIPKVNSGLKSKTKCQLWDKVKNYVKDETHLKFKNQVEFSSRPRLNSTFLLFHLIHFYYFFLFIKYGFSIISSGWIFDKFNFFIVSIPKYMLAISYGIAKFKTSRAVLLIWLIIKSISVCL